MLRLRRVPKGSVQRIAVSAHGGVAVFEGRIWATQPDDPRDHIIDAGDVHVVGAQTELLVQALTDSAIVDLEPALSPAAARAVPEPRRITAYALARVARDMRHAAIARYLARAAGAMSLLLQSSWRSVRQLMTAHALERPVIASSHGAKASLCRDCA